MKDKKYIKTEMNESIEELKVQSMEDFANEMMCYFSEEKEILSKSIIFDSDWADRKMEIIKKFISATEDLLDFIETEDWD